MRHDAELNGIPDGDFGEPKLQVVERDFSIRVNDSLDHQAKDIFSGLEGGRDHELSKEGHFFLQGSLEAQGGDLSGGTMDLVVVIAVDFEAEDLAGLGDRLGIFSGAGSDEPILEPAIGPFDLAFGLRGERIARLDVTVAKDPFPLGVDIIGGQIMFSPDGIPALDETENGVAVGVIGIGGAIA